MPETFHRRGNHVQKAHGRRTALAATDSHLSDGMIALMPTAQDARRLALPGGEAPEELHCTLLYLGDDGSVFSSDDRDALEEAFTHAVADYGVQPVQANIFGVAHWNGDGEKPSWVWSVGDNPDRTPEDDALEDMRALTGDALGMAMAMTDGELPEAPPQHSPWVAHICAAYTDDLTLVRRLEKGLGPVTFDRIRLSFGDDDRDIPLTGEALTASARLRDGDRIRVKSEPHMKGQSTGLTLDPGQAAEILFDGMEDQGIHYWYFGKELEPEALTASALRRDVFPHEDGVDFAEHNAQWESAVASADGRLVQVFSSWRTGISDQIKAGIGTPDELTGLTVDPDAAAEILSEAMVDLAHRAGQSLARQAEKQGVQVPDWSLPDDTVTAAVGGRKLLRSVARMTADLLSSSVVQTAKRTVTGLFARDASPETIASEVDRALADAQDGLLKGPVGTAMSTAQTAGREAVLRAAPPGEYYASEMLDKNTCGPCRAVDGEQFGDLERAIKAYPVMGYKDCVGPRYGHSCRGLIVARWAPDEAQTASAATMRAEDQPEEEPVTTEALRKGKPSKGTKKDKRLDENQYADEGHFQGGVETLGWNGSAARFTDPEYRKACAGCDPGGTAKESCFLPHHEPGGALNKDGVHAAAQRVDSLSGHSPEAVARAKAHLRGHYKTLGEKPPDSIAATAEEIESFGVEDGYEVVEFESTCPPGTRRVKGGDCEPPQKKIPGQLEEDDVETLAKGDCPPGMEMDKTTGKCAEMQQMAVQVSDTTAPWRGPLTVEGIETGDGRQFDTGSLTWADLPLPLRWNIEDSHGGEARTKAVNVGRIDKIWREDSGLIMGEGVLDLGDDNGQAAQKKIEGKFLRGVSVDVDSVKDADMELIWPDHDPDGGEEADPFAQLFAAPEKVVFHKGRIRAATLVDIPAFAEAYIALLDGEGAVTAGGEPIGALRASQAPRTHLALAPPVQPPADWFRNPDLSVPTGITVSADGRVYGHAALWGTCHIGQAGVCVTPPQEDDHPYFMTGSVLLDDGEQASVGQITLGTGHAPLDYGHHQASDHYDNTGSAVADVSVGNDAHGIWVAGSIRPGTDPARIHELRASGQVSGDWRSIGGKLRLVGLLAVNVPGFPVPKLRTKYTSGRQLALVAAGMPDLRESMTEDDLDQWAYRRVLVKLAERVHRKR